MGPEGLILDLAVSFLVAFVAGGIATRFRQPVILGYLIGGLVVGPYALGLVQHLDVVSLLAEIGVAFLMFFLGVELNREELGRVKWVAVVGGIAQIVLTIGLGFGLGVIFGWSSYESLFFGSLIALSSTMVVLKVLMDRGQIEALHARVSLGILIVQDLSVVIMMVILPSLGSDSASLGMDLLLAGLKGAALLAGTIFLGPRVIPAVLNWVALTRSRELFLLAVVAICLGTAFGTYYLGLSIALGAFLAGVIVSTSVFKYQIMAEIRPLRDIFSVLFFVSVGMLIDPAFIVNNATLVVTVVPAIIVGKFLIAFLVIVIFGYSGRVAALSALTLVQIGEFSFVLAKVGFDIGAISEQLYSLTLTSALLTIVLTPLIMQLSPAIISFLERIPILNPLFVRLGEEHKQPAEGMSQHVVICGHGGVGSRLAEVLGTRGFKYFVVDNDPNHVARLRKAGVACVFGDAANPHVLEQANLTRAKLLVVTVADPMSTHLVVREALEINPKLDIVARASSAAEGENLRTLGCQVVVEPKFEAALEIVRHTLHRFGVSTTEALLLTNRMRLDHYQATAEEEEMEGPII